jgi:crotonobetainyl-CoA:carnitine CoA-transferase CaiB-like acyl-CoA transferase
MDYLANGEAAEPCGNASPYGDHAPYGIYPCSGDDAWIALACANDDEWHAARIVLGIPTRPEWAMREGRHQDREALDETISAVTKRRDRFELMAALQAVGVPAGAVMTAEDLVMADPQLAEREWFGTAECERFGTYGLDRFPALFDGVRPARYDGPVAVGADTYDVLSTILGIDDDTIAGLMAEGALT